MSFPARLIAGYRSFRDSRLPQEQARYRELAERGQSPEIMVIGCCDSRVSPELIFDAGPGELFADTAPIDDAHSDNVRHCGASGRET